MSVHKSGGSRLYPFTCARAVGAVPAAIPSGAEEAKPQDNQNNAKPETRRAGPRARPEPCWGNLPDTSRAATLQPKGSNTIDHFGTEAREAPPWWHANLKCIGNYGGETTLL